MPLRTRLRVTNLNNERNHVSACAARKPDRRVMGRQAIRLSAPRSALGPGARPRVAWHDTEAGPKRVINLQQSLTNGAADVVHNAHHDEYAE
ncbi:MAG: hypothetical protein MZW92_16455 [Comamonadaceae bacterium]|nr:hypothetical protein [Comamonadaceae bacterium]